MFNANGTTGVEIRKLDTNFAPKSQWTHGNLSVRSTDVKKWHWWQFCIKNVELTIIKNNDRRSSFCKYSITKAFNWVAFGPMLRHSCFETKISRKKMQRTSAIIKSTWEARKEANNLRPYNTPAVMCEHRQRYYHSFLAQNKHACCFSWRDRTSQHIATTLSTFFRIHRRWIPYELVERSIVIGVLTLGFRYEPRLWFGLLKFTIDSVRTDNSQQ